MGAAARQECPEGQGRALYEEERCELLRLQEPPRRGQGAQADPQMGCDGRGLNDVTPLFVLSFCKHDEDSEEFKHGLLSQWRGYGEAGAFAIELDEIAVDELLKVEMKKFAYAGSKSDNVLYEKYATLFLADDFKGIAGEMTRRIFEPRDVSEVTGRKDVDAFMPKFMTVAPFMKHRGF